MKGNTISLNPLNESGKFWLQKTLQLFKIQEYGKGVHYVYEFKKNRKKLQKPPIGKQCGIAEQRIAKIPEILYFRAFFIMAFFYSS